MTKDQAVPITKIVARGLFVWKDAVSPSPPIMEVVVLKTRHPIVLLLVMMMRIVQTLVIIVIMELADCNKKIVTTV